MRINVVMGFFLPVPPVAGGALEKVWFRLAREFTASGHEVSLISRRWPGFPDLEWTPGGRLIRVEGFDHTRRLATNLVLDSIWGGRVLRHLPAADVTICNTVSLPVHLPWTRRSAGVVVVVLARMPKGQTRFYRRASRLIAISRSVAEQVAVESSKGSERTRVVPLPIDWSLHAEAACRTGDPVTIGFIGRLHPEKGIGLLLRAARMLAADRSLPDWRLLVKGPEDVRSGGGGAAYVDGLRAEHDAPLAGRLRWEPAEFDATRLARSFGAIDVFCYPSLAEKGEALGVAPLEAMASGAVPVVSRLGCFADLIQNERNGLTFDHRSVDSDVGLATVLSRLVRDRDLRLEMGRRAQDDSRRFDYPVVARTLLDDFSHLASLRRYGRMKAGSRGRSASILGPSRNLTDARRGPPTPDIEPIGGVQMGSERPSSARA